METTINTRLAHTNVQTTANTTAPALITWWKNLENNRFGIIALLVAFIGCAGGLCAAFGAGDSAVQLGMIVFPTIITLAFTLAVAPMRLIFWGSVFALTMDLLVLFF